MTFSHIINKISQSTLPKAPPPRPQKKKNFGEQLHKNDLFLGSLNQSKPPPPPLFFYNEKSLSQG